MNRYRRPPIVLGLSLAAALACADPPSVVEHTVAFTGATVWDGTGSAPHQADILVRDGRIIEVGEPRIPDDATIVDATGKWIVPGLVEAHAHVTGYWAPAAVSDTTDRVLADLALYAHYGVTTVNSLGGEPAQARAIRDGQATPRLDRARLSFAGPVITSTTPADAQSAVARNADADVDWMKIRVDDNLGTTTKMPWPVVDAVVATSHERGLRLATHMFYLDDAKQLLRRGSDLIAHSVRDEPVDEEFIQLMRETGTCYVPTLTREVSTFVYGKHPAFFDDPFFKEGAPPAEVERVSQPAFMEQMEGSPAAARYREALAQAQRNLKVLVDEGIPVAFGTDAGPPARFPGYFEHMELGLMVEAGLTPAEALSSATRVAAECLRLPDVGTLEAGKWADLLVLAADPLADISATKTLEATYIAGNRVR